MKLTYKKLSDGDWKISTSIEKTVSDGKLFKAFIKEVEAKEYLRKSNVFLVMLGKEQVGTISYELINKNHAYIDAMTILPEYQGKGYASEALEWLLTKLTKFERVDLATHPHNSKAIIIYLKHGFIIERWKDNYFGDGEPRIVLVLAKR